MIGYKNDKTTKHTFIICHNINLINCVILITPVCYHRINIIHIDIFLGKSDNLRCFREYLCISLLLCFFLRISNWFLCNIVNGSQSCSHNQGNNKNHSNRHNNSLDIRFSALLFRTLSTVFLRFAVRILYLLIFCPFFMFLFSLWHIRSLAKRLWHSNTLNQRNKQIGYNNCIGNTLCTSTKNTQYKCKQSKQSRIYNLSF